VHEDKTGDVTVRVQGRVSCRFVRRSLSGGTPVCGFLAAQPTAVVQKRLLRPGRSHQFGLARTNSCKPAKYNDYTIHWCSTPQACCTTLTSTKRASASA